MDRIDQAKPDFENEEVVKPSLLEKLPLPQELASLDDVEVEKLEKTLVRRLDMFMLPAVVILFLLNILDRYGNLANLVYAKLNIIGIILPMPKSQDYQSH